MKKFLTAILAASAIWLTASTTEAVDDAQKFKDAYNLQGHSEGGWFAEIYTAPF